MTFCPQWAILLKMFRFLKTNKKRVKITDSLISDAYKKRKSELDSLKAYDRGEKTITPRKLRSAM